MGRAPCCSKVGLHRGPWTAREDALLTKYIRAQGEGNWRSLPKKAGLLRCGKSCRLRWMNYLRPDIKRGNITPDEDDLIIKMHALLGNRWSLIAGRLPGRTDNEIKNYWNTHLSKKLRIQGTDPNTHRKLADFPHIKEPAKKRRNSNNLKLKQQQQKKKNDKSKSKVDPSPTQKLKVHNPKPVRITRLSSFSLSRSSKFDLNNITTSSSHEGNGNEAVLDHVPWSADGVDFSIRDHDLINGFDFGCQSLEAMPDGTLEKLYEEYQQLLNIEDEVQVDQLDSFAESFLI